MPENQLDDPKLPRLEGAKMIKHLHLFLSNNATRLLSIALLVVALVWVDPLNVIKEKPNPDVGSLWNEGISTLGIEAIYPMTEDIKFGDVFLRVSTEGLSDDQKKSENIRAILLRSIRVARLKLPPEEQQTPRYAETQMCEPKLEAANECPLINSIDPPTIAVGGSSSLQPTVVGFPTIRLKTKGDASVDALPAGIQGLGSSNEEILSIAIPEAYTVGASPSEATLALLNFCTEKTTQNLCSEALNRFLISSSFKGPILTPVGMVGGKECYLQLELSIIVRTYFTRSMVVTREKTESRFLGGWFLPTSPNSIVQAAPSSEPTRPASNTKLANSGLEQKIGSSVRFRRPVVFGYRSATFPLDHFSTTEDRSKSKYLSCAEKVKK